MQPFKGKKTIAKGEIIDRTNKWMRHSKVQSSDSFLTVL